MTRYAATRGEGLANTLAAIRNRKAFDAGNLWATTHRFSLGILPLVWTDDYMETRDRIDYVVYSYATPIAWHLNTGEWVYPDVRYSASTQRHQSTVRHALGQWGKLEDPIRSHTLASERRAAEIFA